MKVRMVPFDRLAKDRTAAFNKLSSESYLPSGHIPIIDQGKAHIAGYTDEESLGVALDKPVVVFGDHTQAFKYVDHPFVLGADGTKVLDVDSALVDPLYFYYVVRTARFPDKGYSRYFKYLKKQSFPVPEDVDYQRRIAALLSRAEGLIAQRKESIRLLDELVRSVFLEMFGDPVRNEKGWKMVPLGKILDQLENGWSPVCEKEPRTSESEWAVLKLGAVSWKRFNHKENKKLPANEIPREAVEVKLGDLLVTRKNTRDLVGTAAYVFTTPPRLLLPDLIFRLEPKPKTIHKIFLCHVFNHPSMRPRLANISSGSASSMPNISMDKLRKLRVPAPDWDLQSEFARSAEETEKLRVGAMRDSAEYIEQLYGSLSQRAFRGELELGGASGPTGSGTHESIVVPGGNAGTGPYRPAGLKDYNRENVKHGKAPPTDKAAPNLDFDLLRYLVVLDDRGDRPFRFEELLEEAARRMLKANGNQLKGLVYRALEADPPLLKQVIVNKEVRTQDGFDTVGQMHLQYIGQDQ